MSGKSLVKKISDLDPGDYEADKSRAFFPASVGTEQTFKYPLDAIERAVQQSVGGDGVGKGDSSFAAFTVVNSIPGTHNKVLTTEKARIVYMNVNQPVDDGNGGWLYPSAIGINASLYNNGDFVLAAVNVQRWSSNPGEVYGFSLSVTSGTSHVDIEKRFLILFVVGDNTDTTGSGFQQPFGIGGWTSGAFDHDEIATMAAIIRLENIIAGGGGGVSPRVRLPQSEDWNNHTTSGFYLKQATSDTNPAPNSPPYHTAGTGDWTLLVIGGTDGGADGSNAPTSPGGCIQIARYASNSFVTLVFRSFGVAGSSNVTGWSAWTSLPFWSGFNAGTSSVLRDLNQTRIPGQYSNEWNANLPGGITAPMRGSLLVMASNVDPSSFNRQQILIEESGDSRIWFRSDATSKWKRLCWDYMVYEGNNVEVMSRAKLIEWWITEPNVRLRINASRYNDGDTFEIKLEYNGRSNLVGSYIQIVNDNGTTKNIAFNCIVQFDNQYQYLMLKMKKDYGTIDSVCWWPATSMPPP